MSAAVSQSSQYSMQAMNDAKPSRLIARHTVYHHYFCLCTLYVNSSCVALKLTYL